jgi:hypothetical protein
MPWLGSMRPTKPSLVARVDSTGSKVSVDWQTTEPASAWLLQTKTSGRWTTEILPSKSVSFTISGAPPDVIAVSAIDRIGNTSAPGVVERKR